MSKLNDIIYKMGLSDKELKSLNEKHCICTLLVNNSDLEKSVDLLKGFDIKISKASEFKLLVLDYEVLKERIRLAYSNNLLETVKGSPSYLLDVSYLRNDKTKKVVDDKKEFVSKGDQELASAKSLFDERMDEILGKPNAGLLTSEVEVNLYDSSCEIIDEISIGLRDYLGYTLNLEDAKDRALKLIIGGYTDMVNIIFGAVEYGGDIKRFVNDPTKNVSLIINKLTVDAINSIYEQEHEGTRSI